MIDVSPQPRCEGLAVRTFVLPFDPVVLREAMQREIFRGGQIFYVCPRILDLAQVEETVRELLPDETDQRVRRTETRPYAATSNAMRPTARSRFCAFWRKG